MTQVCCTYLAHYKMPLFVPSTMSMKPMSERWFRARVNYKKMLPAPFMAFGLPENGSERRVGFALICCAICLAIVHFGRFVAILADHFDEWKYFYEPIDPFLCALLRKKLRDVCDGYEGIHITHAIFEILVTISLLVGIPPSVVSGIGILPLIVAFSNVLLIVPLCIIAILKLIHPRGKHLKLLRRVSPQMIKKLRKRLELQSGLLVFCIVLDILSCCCLLVLAWLFCCYSKSDYVSSSETESLQQDLTEPEGASEDWSNDDSIDDFSNDSLDEY